MTVVLGIAAIALLWWLFKDKGRGPLQISTERLRQGGALLIGLTAGLMLMRGRIDMALLLGAGAFWLWQGMPGLSRLTGGSAPQMAKVRTAMIELDLNRRTGALSGSVLAGPFAGRDLDTLEAPALLALLMQCRQSDGEGARLLEAYLDRRLSGWREHAERDFNTRPARETVPGAMTEQEAHQILGLGAGASSHEIVRAHRELMKRLHPDMGGSDYLAARVNQAKDILLARHR